MRGHKPPLAPFSYALGIEFDSVVFIIYKFIVYLSFYSNWPS